MTIMGGFAGSTMNQSRVHAKQEIHRPSIRKKIEPQCGQADGTVVNARCSTPAMRAGSPDPNPSTPPSFGFGPIASSL